MVKERLGEPGNQTEQMVTFVADLPGAPVVGWIQVVTRQILISAFAAEIEGLVVDQRRRGMGIGHHLIEAAEQWAKARGCALVRVRSNVIRMDAHRFYEMMGYVNIKKQLAFEKVLSDEPARS